MNSIIIDARILTPQEKHPKIIEHVQNLVPGEHMILINDHDPKPLYYQLQKMMGEVFSWEYIVSGIDDVWKIKIKKKMQFMKTVGELAAQYPAAPAVLEKYRIEFCCKGDRYIADVCAEMDLDYHAILREIKEAEAGKKLRLRYDDWSSSLLCDFIINNHHNYVRKTAPQIIDLIEKVINVHGITHHNLGELQSGFIKLMDKLYPHMSKEEEELFPAIKLYEQEGIFSTKDILKSILKKEHVETGAELNNIRKLCYDFVAPMDACASFEMLYEMLHEFEEDLHQHIHIENNILFPRMDKTVKLTSCAV